MKYASLITALMLALLAACGGGQAAPPTGTPDQPGAGGSGSTSTPDLSLNLNISGLTLVDLTTGASGAFGPGKFATRVIEPIDVVDRKPVGSVTITGTRSSVSGLPRGRVLLVNINYRPTVSLLGGAKLPAAAGDETDGLVTTALPVFVPATEGEVAVDTSIVLTPNPAGGYYVSIDSAVTTPGDDPSTPAVESSYQQHWLARQDYQAGIVSRDTDGNGSFDDEARLDDSDRDGVSNPMIEKELEDHGDGVEREDFDLRGTLSAIDEAAGVLTLTGVTSDENSALPSTMVLHFCENSRFEERVISGGEDSERDLAPSQLAIGDSVEASAYGLGSAGAAGTVFWVEELKRVTNDDT